MRERRFQMKQKTKKNAAVMTVMALVLGLTFSVPSRGEICRDALNDCLEDAIWPGILVVIFSGPMFLAEVGTCAIGYEWCTRYIRQ
jgi:hypothetical protein